MGKREKQPYSSAESFEKKARMTNPVDDATEGDLLVNPEKPWYLIKIREAWEVTGPRPGSNTEVDEIQERAAKVYSAQVDLFNKRIIT